MISSISWIDPEGLEATLARIGRHIRGPAAPARRRPPLHPPESTAPQTTAVPLVEPQPSLAAGLPPTIEPRIVPEFLPPDGPLRRRLEAFMTWIVQVSGSSVAFIVDRDGLPLVNRRADPDLLSIASSIMRMVASINSKLSFPVGGAVTLDLEEHQLMVIAVETSIGTYIVGQVGDVPLGRELREAAVDALRRAFQPSPEEEVVS